MPGSPHLDLRRREPARQVTTPRRDAVDNVRSVDSSSAVPTAQVAKQGINGGMPNRISMNVTVARQTRSAEVDGAPIEVDVGADGALSGRVAAQ